MVVIEEPVEIGLQVLEGGREPLSTSDSVTLVEPRLGEPLANAVGLRGLGLGA